MNLNLDGSSPWFHVHFTLPNQGNKRSEIKYDSQRKRIKDLIQNKDAFLAPTCQRGNLSRSGANKPVKKSKDESKRKLDNDSSGNFTLRTPWLSPNSIKKSSDTQKKGSFIENRIFIDSKASNTTKQQDRKSIFPPLEGSKAGVITCCPGQQDKVTESKTDKDSEVKNTDQRIEMKTENKLSIADCYDLCNWKPQNSLCKGARPLVSILKQNTRTPRPRQGQSSIPTDSSESSGNETENETTKRNKKVRFAKGTKFSPSTRSKKYRKKRNYLDSKFEADKELPGDESNLEDMIELSFREFIQRKRLERSKVMAEMSKDSSMLCFLKEENKLPKLNTTRKQHKQQSKRSGADQEDRGSKVDTLLPTVVN